MNEPTTEMRSWRAALLDNTSHGWGVPRVAIEAIEAEVRRAVLTTLRERVEELLSLDELHADGPEELYDREGRAVAWPMLVSRAAVLAEIDRLMAEADKPEEATP